jgi:hypothetical protein
MSTHLYNYPEKFFLSLLFPYLRTSAVGLAARALRAKAGARSTPYITRLSRLLTIICPLILTACTVGPDYRRPASAAATNFKELKGWKQAQPRDHELPGKWWRIFKDPYLNALEEQVDIANQSIAQAEAQYRQAQSLVQSASAAYFPTATATATVNRFRAASGQNVAVPGVKYLFGAALSAAWEPDFWGSARRQVESIKIVEHCCETRARCKISIKLRHRFRKTRIMVIQPDAYHTCKQNSQRLRTKSTKKA